MMVASTKELRFAGHFDFRLPAKELRGEKKSKYGPANQGTQRDKDVVVPNVRRSKNGTAESLNKIGCRKEQRNFLYDLRKESKRKGGAGKKDERKPDELVDDLGLLHGVGDAGDDEAQRGEGNHCLW